MITMLQTGRPVSVSWDHAADCAVWQHAASHKEQGWPRRHCEPTANQTRQGLPLKDQRLHR